LFAYKIEFEEDSNSNSIIKSVSKQIDSIPKIVSCGSRIKKISSIFKKELNEVHVAVCSDDYTVRIYSITINDLENF
jgi:hypothetical protein